MPSGTHALIVAASNPTRPAAPTARPHPSPSPPYRCSAAGTAPCTPRGFTPCSALEVLMLKNPWETLPNYPHHLAERASCCCGLCTPEPVSLCDGELRRTPEDCGPRAQYQSREQLVQLESICSNGSRGSSDGAKSAGPGGGSVHGRWDRAGRGSWAVPAQWRTHVAGQQCQDSQKELGEEPGLGFAPGSGLQPRGAVWGHVTALSLRAQHHFSPSSPATSFPSPCSRPCGREAAALCLLHVCRAAPYSKRSPSLKGIISRAGWVVTRLSLPPAGGTLWQAVGLGLWAHSSHQAQWNLCFWIWFAVAFLLPCSALRQ